MRHATSSDPQPPRRGEKITTAGQAAIALNRAVAVLARPTGGYRVNGLRGYDEQLVQVTLTYDTASGPVNITTARDDDGSMLTVGIKARMCEALLNLVPTTAEPDEAVRRGRELFANFAPIPVDLVVDERVVQGLAVTYGPDRAVAAEIADCSIIIAGSATADAAPAVTLVSASTPAD